MYRAIFLARPQPLDHSVHGTRPKVTSPPENIFYGGKTVSNNPILENRGWFAATNNNEWIKVDLGGVSTVGSSSTSWNGHAGEPISYYVETSLDDESWTQVRSGSGDFTPADARYVRLFVAQGLNFIELCKWEVTGTPVSTKTVLSPINNYALKVHRNDSNRRIYDLSGKIIGTITPQVNSLFPESHSTALIIKGHLRASGVYAMEYRPRAEK